MDGESFKLYLMISPLGKEEDIAAIKEMLIPFEKRTDRYQPVCISLHTETAHLFSGSHGGWDNFFLIRSACSKNPERQEELKVKYRIQRQVLLRLL